MISFFLKSGFIFSHSWFIMKFHFWVLILFFLSLNWDLFTADEKEETPESDVTLKVSADESTEGDVTLKAAPEEATEGDVTLKAAPEEATEGDVTLKAAPEESSEGDVTLKASPEHITENGDVPLKAAPEVTTEEGDVTLKAASEDATEGGDVILKAAPPETTTVRTTTIRTTTELLTQSTVKTRTISPIKAAKLNWLNKTNERNIKMRKKYNATLEKYKDKYQKKDKFNKFSPNTNLTELSKNKTKEYYQARMVKTFGVQMTKFTACMGVDWVKRCYIHMAMCAILTIPLLCLWTLACGGMNTRKCHRQAYPQFSANTTTPLSVSSPIFTTIPPIPDALQEARRRKRYADWL